MPIMVTSQAPNAIIPNEMQGNCDSVTIARENWSRQVALREKAPQLQGLFKKQSLTLLDDFRDDA